MPIMRRRFPRRMVRSRRRWQWIRSNENTVTVVGPAAFEQKDLLQTYRALAGIDLNLPEFTIWRVRFKISIRINVSPAVQFTPNDGVKLAVFVDDMADPGVNPVTGPYDEKYMLWDTIYVYETLMASRGVTSGTSENIALFRDYDIKTHRKIGNLKETLLFQIAPLGAATIHDYAWTQNTLVLLGR